MKTILIILFIFLWSVFCLAFGPEVDFRTTDLGTKSCFSYAFHYPITDIVPGVDIDFGFSMFQTEIGGELYFGKPSSDSSPSKNPLNGISIYGLGLRTKYIDIRYGQMNYYTKGIGLLFDSYTKNYAWALDAKLKFIQPGITLHAPLEITTFLPFELSKTGSLYWGGFFFDFPLNMVFDTTLIWETNKELTQTEDASGNLLYTAYAISSSLDLPLLNWKLIRLIPSIEIGALSTKDFGTYGLGAGAGGRFSILDLLNVKGGLVVYYKDFIPNYFDSDYEYKKKMTLYEEEVKLPPMKVGDGVSSGWYINGDLTIGTYVLLKASYYSYNNVPTSPILKGYCKIKIPEVNLGKYGEIPMFYAEGSYYQTSFSAENLFTDEWKNELINENTRFEISLTYPISEVIYTKILIGYNPVRGTYNYEFNVSTE